MEHALDTALVEHSVVEGRYGREEEAVEERRRLWKGGEERRGRKERGAGAHEAHR